MKRYKFKAKISKKSDRLPGKEYFPKGFYYQGKKDIVLVGDEATGDTTRLKLPLEDVEIEVIEPVDDIPILTASDVKKALEKVKKKGNICSVTERLENTESTAMKNRERLIQFKTFAEFDFSERCCNREIINFSSHYGTYGMGGPGFFGLDLKETEKYPQERIVLRIWGAAEWLLYDGRWMEAHPKYYGIEKPLFSNFRDAWSEVDFKGMKISEIHIKKDSFTFLFDNKRILGLPENVKVLPLHGSGSERKWYKHEKAADALILVHINSTLWV